jgi:small subunit ribosomal protein S2
MLDLKKMLEVGVHFGHKTSRWSPKMRPYIWGARNKVHLIDVSKTAMLLEHAGKFLKEVASTGGQFLFVGTKKAAQDIVKDSATAVKMPFVIHRWVGGTLSNYEQVKKAITRLMHMRDVVKKGVTHYKKKEISMIQKEIARLEKNVGGIVGFEYPPAALILVDAKKEASAVKEAKRLNIPVVALIDTNTDPEGVSFIIPGNDDSPKAIAYVVKYLEECVKEGQQLFESNRAKLQAEARAKRESEVAARAKDLNEKLAAKAAAKKSATPATPAAAKEHKPAAPAAPAAKEVKPEAAQAAAPAKETVAKKEAKPEAKAEAKEVKAVKPDIKAQAKDVKAKAAPAKETKEVKAK